MRRSVSVMISALLLSSCATAVDKTYQMVEVVTPGVIGVECELTTSENKYRVITPGLIQVQRSPEALQVECKKAYYHPALLTVDSAHRIMRAAILNGINGIAPGTTYDIASNAVYRYPNTISVKMELDPDALADGKYGGDPAPEKLAKKKVKNDLDVEALAPEKAPAAKAISKTLRK